MNPERFSAGLVFSVYTQANGSEMKTSRFGDVSGDVESEI